MTKQYLDKKESIIAFIKRVVELNPDYLISWSTIHRFRKKYKLKDYIHFILDDFPDWLHFSEINLKIRERYNIIDEDRKVHMNLTHFPELFMNIGLGLYTLKTNNKYSAEKVWDLIYLYLKETWRPLTLDELINYVTSRKVINPWTVSASLSYTNEFRFTFLKDWKIALKEWNRDDIRIKRIITKYNVPLEEAFNDSLNAKILTKNFTLNELQKILSNRYGNDITNKRAAYSSLLTQNTNNWVLSCNRSKLENLYSLI